MKYTKAFEIFALPLMVKQHKLEREKEEVKINGMWKN
jgi:hypothetical protein